jgi:hypothetical protein
MPKITAMFTYSSESTMAGKKAAPFVYLGQLSYKEHTGAEPMNVTWEMAEILPIQLKEEFIES